MVRTAVGFAADNLAVNNLAVERRSLAVGTSLVADRSLAVGTSLVADHSLVGMPADNLAADNLAVDNLAVERHSLQVLLAALIAQRGLEVQIVLLVCP